MIFDTSDHKWNRQASFNAAVTFPGSYGQTSVATAVQNAVNSLVGGTVEGGVSGALFTCVSRSVSDGDLFMVRVSFGLGTPLVY